jgi:hypothetical protein
MTDARAIDDFTLDGYRALISALLKRGYIACDFATADPEKAHLILRHDLDISIQAALPIAEIEAELGVGATYFVLVRTEMYNPFSDTARRDLGRLEKLGHRIGLHFDAALYSGGAASLDAAATAECGVLETILGRPVEAISLHRLAPDWLGRREALAGRLHTYQPRFFEGMGFCADSRGEWRFGNPLDNATVAAGRALQLATHPIWWNAAPGETVRAKLDRFALKRFDLLRAELARHCRTYPQAFAALGGDGRDTPGGGDS